MWFREFKCNGSFRLWNEITGNSRLYQCFLLAMSTVIQTRSLINLHHCIPSLLSCYNLWQNVPHLPHKSTLQHRTTFFSPCQAQCLIVLHFPVCYSLDAEPIIKCFWRIYFSFSLICSGNLVNAEWIPEERLVKLQSPAVSITIKELYHMFPTICLTVRSWFCFVN